MKVVFHEDFFGVYTADPASEAGRLEPAARRVRAAHEIVEPTPADEATVALVHEPAHIAAVRTQRKVYEMALLAAGAALHAARLGADGEPAFSLARPPGHHASPGDAWGFCYFNNMAVAVEALLRQGAVRSALILDIDLHFGDGTANAFRGRDDVTYLHPEGSTREVWLEECRRGLEKAAPTDLIAVSAGFDRHRDDWGELLETRDYETIGGWVKGHADWHCRGRRFGVLEGGYAPAAMAEALEALLAGMG
jgi:acetoin utilization deacetylase AcuC-like enzyme